MKVAVMGYGTVGSGVVEVIEHHSDIIPKRTGGKTLEISHILDLRDFPNRNLLVRFCSFSADVSLCTGSGKIIPPG